MAKRDVERAKRRMKRYDPQLVMMALQDIDVSKADVEKAKASISKAYAAVKAKAPQEKMKVLSQAMAEVDMEVYQKEIETVRAKLKDFDRAVLVEAAQEVLEFETPHCFYSICICPEGCHWRFIVPCFWLFRIPCRWAFLGSSTTFYRIRRTFFHLIPPDGDCGYNIHCEPRVIPCIVELILPGAELEHTGLSQIQAIRELDRVDRANIVIGDGARLGLLDKCLDPVDCTGRQILVMTKCKAALFAFDVKGTIDPIDAIIRVAESDPVLQRRVKRMVDSMKKAGEL